MNDQEKLPVLIHHWIEHNDSHRTEFEKWAQRAAELGLGVVADAIRVAAGSLEQASASLSSALEVLESSDT